MLTIQLYLKKTKYYSIENVIESNCYEEKKILCIFHSQFFFMSNAGYN